MRKKARAKLPNGLSHSFFVKRGAQVEYVKAGDVFRPRGEPQFRESAKILSLGLDGQRIPHVRFRLLFRRGRGIEIDGGSRIMALKPFLKLYSERVPPAAPAPALKAAE